MIEFIVQYLCLTKKHEGQSFVEYGIILALVSVVAVAVLKTMGN